MKPIDQDVMHRPEISQAGNCFSAFLASVLEIPLADVPHFIADWPSPEEFLRRINAFLRPLNLGFLTIGDARNNMRQIGIEGLVHELMGEFNPGVAHATVGVDGEMVHDPHPDKRGLRTFYQEWGMFIVLDPSKPAGRFAG